MSVQLLVLCAVTVTVLATVYRLTDVSLPADHQLTSVTNKRGSRVAPTLQLVFVVTRHGNRAPLFTFPTSQYQEDDTKVWPHGPGQLTHSGRLQMYNLGVKFRSLYNGFLGPYYKPEDFKAFSTPKERSLQSAELFLAGLFPPTDYQVWNKRLMWQPVPVFPNFKDHYELVPPREYRWCPKFHEAKKESLNQFELKYGSNITDFFQYVIPYTGYEYENETLATPRSPFRLDTLYAMFESFSHPEDEGFPLPSWSRKVYPHPLKFLIAKYYKYLSFKSDTQIRYVQGELFQAIVKGIQAKVDRSPGQDLRMYYYSGHDYTILGLLGILGLNGEEWERVNTGSALIIELHSDPVKDDGSFYVQVLYLDGGSPNLDSKRVNIPGCVFPCDLHLLLNITEKYYNITDWQRECQLSTNT